MSELLLVGEDNPQSEKPEHALFPYPQGCAGSRLMTDILGLRRQTYLRLARTNLCCPTWDRWDAESRAGAIIAQVVDMVDYTERRFSPIVMLGRKVTSAFGFRKDALPFFAHTEGAPGQTFVSLPHPSGRCREWNDATNYQRTIDLMRTVAPNVPWGERWTNL